MYNKMTTPYIHTTHSLPMHQLMGVHLNNNYGLYPRGISPPAQLAQQTSQTNFPCVQHDNLDNFGRAGLHYTHNKIAQNCPAHHNKVLDENTQGYRGSSIAQHQPTPTHHGFMNVIAERAKKLLHLDHSKHSEDFAYGYSMTPYNA